MARKKFTKALAEVKGRQALAVRQVALTAEREIKLGLSKGAPGGKALKPLSPITILTRKRRSSKPLLDTGGLRNSIKTTFNATKMAAFVGVHRSARGPGRKDVLNIALVHEFGTKPYAIPVTPGVRRFFRFLAHASGGQIKPISRNKQVIMHPGVPKRPFIRPVIEKIGPKLEAALKKTFEAGGGLL